MRSSGTRNSETSRHQIRSVLFELQGARPLSWWLRLTSGWVRPRANRCRPKQSRPRPMMLPTGPSWARPSVPSARPKPGRYQHLCKRAEWSTKRQAGVIKLWGAFDRRSTPSATLRALGAGRPSAPATLTQPRASRRADAGAQRQRPRFGEPDLFVRPSLNRLAEPTTLGLVSTKDESTNREWFVETKTMLSKAGVVPTNMMHLLLGSANLGAGSANFAASSIGARLASTKARARRAHPRSMPTRGWPNVGSVARARPERVRQAPSEVRPGGSSRARPDGEDGPAALDASSAPAERSSVRSPFSLQTPWAPSARADTQRGALPAPNTYPSLESTPHPHLIGLGPSRLFPTRCGLRSGVPRPCPSG